MTASKANAWFPPVNLLACCCTETFAGFQRLGPPVLMGFSFAQTPAKGALSSIHAPCVALLKSGVGSMLTWLVLGARS